MQMGYQPCLPRSSTSTGFILGRGQTSRQIRVYISRGRVYILQRRWANLHILTSRMYVYACMGLTTPTSTSLVHPSIRPHATSHVSSVYFPAEYETTAHLPLHAHLRAPLSPPPPSAARSSSSVPGWRPTTTSALHVRSASTLTPEPGPSGPIASVNGVVGSQAACEFSPVRLASGMRLPT